MKKKDKIVENKKIQKMAENSTCISGSNVTVSNLRDAEWDELIEKVIHENIGAWENLSKE